MPPEPIRKICVQWPRFGPYHLARLRAAHTHFCRHGVEVIGLETASNETTYAWRTEQGATPFRREQVFPGRVFEEISPSDIHRGILRALDRINPDAVAINSYSFPDARACLYWCRRNRRTAVVINDSKEDDASRSPTRERLKSLLIRQFDAALLAGTPHRAYFEKLGFPPEAIFLGCDVVDNEYFARESSRMRLDRDARCNLPGLNDESPFFLAVGRFIKVKNFDGLLRAYRLYRNQSNEPWRLILVGDGPERPALESLVRQENMTGVTFAGFRNVEELPAYYGCAGALILPSHKDTWGLVVNEAMAAGLPVLASTRTGCAVDLVREHINGFCIEPENIPGLASLMTQLSSLSDADRRIMGERAREIISTWSLTRFAENLWSAVQAGSKRSKRAFNPVVKGILVGLNHATQRVNAFHSVRD